VGAGGGGAAAEREGAEQTARQQFAVQHDHHHHHRQRQLQQPQGATPSSSSSSSAAASLDVSPTAHAHQPPPRTAGRTFHTCLLKQGVPPAKRCPKSYDHLRIDVELPDCKLLSSHDDFSVVQQLPRGTAVVTQLRDPVERFLSAYEFAVEVGVGVGGFGCCGCVVVVVVARRGVAEDSRWMAVCSRAVGAAASLHCRVYRAPTGCPTHHAPRHPPTPRPPPHTHPHTNRWPPARSGGPAGSAPRAAAP